VAASACVSSVYVCVFHIIYSVVIVFRNFVAWLCALLCSVCALCTSMSMSMYDLCRVWEFFYVFIFIKMHIVIFNLASVPDVDVRF